MRARAPARCAPEFAARLDARGRRGAHGAEARGLARLVARRRRGRGRRGRDRRRWSSSGGGNALELDVPSVPRQPASSVAARARRPTAPARAEPLQRRAEPRRRHRAAPASSGAQGRAQHGPRRSRPRAATCSRSPTTSSRRRSASAAIVDSLADLDVGQRGLGRVRAAHPDGAPRRGARRAEQARARRARCRRARPTSPARSSRRRDRLKDARAERRGAAQGARPRDHHRRRSTPSSARLRDNRSQIAAAKGELNAAAPPREPRRASTSPVAGQRPQGLRRRRWTPGDAAHDALRVLEVAAGVLLIGARGRGPARAARRRGGARGALDAPPAPRERAGSRV